MQPVISGMSLGNMQLSAGGELKAGASFSARVGLPQANGTTQLMLPGGAKMEVAGHLNLPAGTAVSVSVEEGDNGALRLMVTPKTGQGTGQPSTQVTGQTGGQTTAGVTTSGQMGTQGGAQLAGQAGGNGATPGAGQGTVSGGAVSTSGSLPQANVPSGTAAQTAAAQAGAPPGAPSSPVSLSSPSSPAVPGGATVPAITTLGSGTVAGAPVSPASSSFSNAAPTTGGVNTGAALSNVAGNVSSNVPGATMGTGTLAAGEARLAAAQANPTATLFADLSALSGASGQGKMPPAVLQLASQILRLRLPTETALTGDMLRGAVERAAASLSNVPGRPSSGASALMPSSGTGVAMGGQVSLDASDAGEAQNLKSLLENLKSEISEVGRTGRNTSQEALEELNRLSQSVERALSHLQGQQTHGSSRPDGGDGARPAVQEKVLEIPLAVGQQTTVLHLRVTRDGRSGTDGAEGEPGWQVRFSLDVPQSGAVDAGVSLSGSSVRTVLKAEEGATLADFVERREKLAADLAALGLDLTSLRILPRRAVRSSGGYDGGGSLVDRKT